MHKDILLKAHTKHRRRCSNTGQPHRWRYTLDELLRQCNPKARRGKRDHDWLAGNPPGRERI